MRCFYIDFKFYNAFCSFRCNLFLEGLIEVTAGIFDIVDLFPFYSDFFGLCRYRLLRFIGVVNEVIAAWNKFMIVMDKGMVPKAVSPQTSHRCTEVCCGAARGLSSFMVLSARRGSGSSSSSLKKGWSSNGILLGSGPPAEDLFDSRRRSSSPPWKTNLHGFTDFFASSEYLGPPADTVRRCAAVALRVPRPPSLIFAALRLLTRWIFCSCSAGGFFALSSPGTQFGSSGICAGLSAKLSTRVGGLMRGMSLSTTSASAFLHRRFHSL